MIARRLPTCPSKSQLIGIANADIVSRLHPRLFQPALNFALMVQIKGFTLKLPVPTGDGGIAGRTQWLGFPKAG